MILDTFAIHPPGLHYDVSPAVTSPFTPAPHHSEGVDSTAYTAHPSCLFSSNGEAITSTPLPPEHDAFAQMVEAVDFTKTHDEQRVLSEADANLLLYFSGDGRLTAEDIVSCLNTSTSSADSFSFCTRKSSPISGMHLTTTEVQDAYPAVKRRKMHMDDSLVGDSHHSASSAGGEMLQHHFSYPTSMMSSENSIASSLCGGDSSQSNFTTSNFDLERFVTVDRFSRSDVSNDSLASSNQLSSTSGDHHHQNLGTTDVRLSSTASTQSALHDVMTSSATSATISSLKYPTMNPSSCTVYNASQQPTVQHHSLAVPSLELHQQLQTCASSPPHHSQTSFSFSTSQPHSLLPPPPCTLKRDKTSLAGTGVSPSRQLIPLPPAPAPNRTSYPLHHLTLPSTPHPPTLSLQHHPQTPLYSLQPPFPTRTHPPPATMAGVVNSSVFRAREPLKEEALAALPFMKEEEYNPTGQTVTSASHAEVLPQRHRGVEFLSLTKDEGEWSLDVEGNHHLMGVDNFRIDSTSSHCGESTATTASLPADILFQHVLEQGTNNCTPSGDLSLEFPPMQSYYSSLAPTQDHFHTDGESGKRIPRPLRSGGMGKAESVGSEEGFEGEDGNWYRRPDVDDDTLAELCDISVLHANDRYSKLMVEFQEGVTFPLGEGGRELLRACLNAKGCKGRQLQGASVPMLLQLARDWGLWNIAVRIKVERATGELCAKHEAFVRFKAMQSQLRKFLKREQMQTERDDTGKITDIHFEEMKYLTLGKEGREKLRAQLRRMHDKEPHKMDDLLEQHTFKYSELRNATVPQLLKMAYICGIWDDVIDACRRQELKREEKSTRREYHNGKTHKGVPKLKLPGYENLWGESPQPDPSGLPLGSFPSHSTAAVLTSHSLHPAAHMVEDDPSSTVHSPDDALIAAAVAAATGQCGPFDIRSLRSAALAAFDASCHPPSPAVETMPATHPVLQTSLSYGQGTSLVHPEMWKGSGEMSTPESDAGATGMAPESSPFGSAFGSEYFFSNCDSFESWLQGFQNRLDPSPS